MTATAPASTAAGGSHPAGPPPINYAHSISSLITRRQAQLDYLQRVHTGQTLYLNTTRLTPNTIPSTLPPKHLRTRITHYLLLGLSLGRLVAVSDASLLLYSMSALLDEFNHFVSHSLSHNNNSDTSASSYYYQSDAIHHTLHVPPFALNQPPQSATSFPIRSHRQTLYTYLLVPTSLSAPPSTSAQSLSYPALLSSLLSVLSRLYAALAALPATAASVAYVTAVDGLKESSAAAVKGDSGEWVKVESGSSSSGGSGGGSGGLGGVDFGAITAMTSVFNAGAMSTTSDNEASVSVNDVSLPH